MMSRRARSGLLVVLTLAVTAAGCGQPFHVLTEPGQADIWVDGKFVGRAGAVVSTNGIVFNSYRVEARDPKGNVLDGRDVDVRFGSRSAIFAVLGLFGVLVWPLLPF